VPNSIPPTDPDDVRRLESMLAKTWAFADERQHPLGRLQGLPLGDWRLLALLGPKNNVGARYFQLFLVGERGHLSGEPIVFGMHNSGPYPGYNWLEVVRYQPAPRLGEATADLRAAGQELPLFQALAELVPPGGHLMVEYESPAQKESERILTLDYPPVTSPLGYLLFSAGCRSFRDWYISEGGREGPRKLQGYKPLNAEIEAERVAVLRRQVASVRMDRENRHGEYGELARRLASAVARDLEGEPRS
jgi:hypothetical protein